MPKETILEKTGGYLPQQNGYLKARCVTWLALEYARLTTSYTPLQLDACMNGAILLYSKQELTSVFMANSYNALDAFAFSNHAWIAEKTIPIALIESLPDSFPYKLKIQTPLNKEGRLSKKVIHSVWLMNAINSMVPIRQIDRISLSKELAQTVNRETFPDLKTTDFEKEQLFFRDIASSIVEKLPCCEDFPPSFSNKFFGFTSVKETVSFTENLWKSNISHVNDFNKFPNIHIVSSIAAKYSEVEGSVAYEAIYDATRNVANSYSPVLFSKNKKIAYTTFSGYFYSSAERNIRDTVSNSQLLRLSKNARRLAFNFDKLASCNSKEEIYAVIDGLPNPKEHSLLEKRRTDANHVYGFLKKRRHEATLAVFSAQNYASAIRNLCDLSLKSGYLTESIEEIKISKSQNLTILSLDAPSQEEGNTLHNVIHSDNIDRIEAASLESKSEVCEAEIVKSANSATEILQKISDRLVVDGIEKLSNQNPAKAIMAIRDLDHIIKSQALVPPPLEDLEQTPVPQSVKELASFASPKSAEQLITFVKFASYGPATTNGGIALTGASIDTLIECTQLWKLSEALCEKASKAPYLSPKSRETPIPQMIEMTDTLPHQQQESFIQGTLF